MVVLFYCFVTFKFFFFLHTFFLFIPHEYVSIKSIDSILLSSFELKEILLIYSVKTLYLSLLNRCLYSVVSLRPSESISLYSK